MTDRDLDKELNDILILKDKLPESIKKAIETANSVPDMTSSKNDYIFVNNRGGTDANS